MKKNGQKLEKKEGIQIWRIEKFKVVKWPSNHYGEFYQGDSYIVLNTYKKDPKSNTLSWNIHFWLGHDSSLDEIGTAAYKTVELDDLLGGGPVEFREVQGFETHEFVGLFQKGIKILQGGIDSGFNIVKPKEFKPKLLHIKGKRPVITEVPLLCSSLNSGDAYILDNGVEVYVWFGSKMNIDEYWKGITTADEMVFMRKQVNAQVIKCSEKEDHDGFFKLLGGKTEIAKAQNDDLEHESKNPHRLFCLTDRNGKFEFKQVAEGKLKRDMFKSDDVFIADVGEAVFCWVGNKATSGEKKKAWSFAIDYLNQHNRPQWLPLVKIGEGSEDRYFYKYIEKLKK